MRIISAFLVVFVISGCASFKAFVFRPPTVCEKLCAQYFVPGSLAQPISPTQCRCMYDDPMDATYRHAPSSLARSLSRSGTATITCHPDCATAAKPSK